MKTQYLKAKVEVKDHDGRITVVASDETLDRHGEVLPVELWDISKFKDAPRMLVDHNHEVSSIVGRWENVRIRGKQLLMDAVFHDITQLAREVKEMVQQNFLDTVSVGFIFNEEDETGDKGKKQNFELIETSWVTVPANPQARVVSSLKSAIEKASEISEEEKNKISKFAEDGEEEVDANLPEDDEQPLPEEEKEPEFIPSKPKIVDMTPEGMQEMGWKIISNKEDFDEWQFSQGTRGNALSLCDTLFLSKLLERSEQLEALTQDKKTRSEAEQKARLSRLALKEAAGLISHALREMNKVD